MFSSLCKSILHRPCLLLFPLPRHRSIHHTPQLQWKLREEYNLPHQELLDRISRLLLLHRPHALSRVSFQFSDHLTDALLHRLRLHPSASLEFVRIAANHQTYRPHFRSYCLIAHILARARMYPETRSFLHELVSLYCKNNYWMFAVWDEIVAVYRVLYRFYDFQNEISRESEYQPMKCIKTFKSAELKKLKLHSKFKKSLGGCEDCEVSALESEDSNPVSLVSTCIYRYFLQSSFATCIPPNRSVSILSNFQAITKNRFQPLSSSYTSKSTLQALNSTLKISRILPGQSSGKSSFRSQVMDFEIFLVLRIDS
ncbi:hypothetical protein PIB30_045652 [Stylosanthes scabra]|uniref:Uncharacterized protein n=1 Tax=Stylosanthes scabra TaxID=79078 RepID=A0ABU6YGT4_9FABA|nr:hypothetical protein [Stylosanthes scabra]